jgi:hypothetical protein
MLAPFDLDTALAYGSGPARLLAAYVAAAVRDRANRLTIGPDPAPRVIGVEVSCTRAEERYLLTPPPIAVLPSFLRLVRRLVSGPTGECSFRLRGELFGARVQIEPADTGERATFDLPVVPVLAHLAGAVTAAHTDKNGMIQFEDTEFT